ncbi:unnamed protein product [Aspergillus oryzae]|nr:unnamed protein product [Aspergillus oryzae]
MHPPWYIYSGQLHLLALRLASPEIRDCTFNMVHANLESVISHRARLACHDTALNHMWDVLDDAWCPSTNPAGYINVGVAENALMQDDLLEFINTTKIDLPAKYLTYNKGGGGSSRLKRAVCQFLNRHLHPVVRLDPEHLIVTNGVSPAIEHVSWAFADPGEGILLGRPYYGIFVTDISMRPQATVVAVNFDGVDPFSIDIMEKYEQALLDYQQNTGKKVRGLMLCNPHNPLGRCYPRNVIIRLMQLCQKYQMHLISDESYALLRSPSLLLLDEATSSLDSQSEKLVQQTIEKLVSERCMTVIAVAHRLATIQKADIIIVFGESEAGRGSRILEQGTHRELLGRRGAYWAMVSF